MSLVAVFPALRTNRSSTARATETATSPWTGSEIETATTRGSRVARSARRPLIGGQLYLEALTVADDRCECSAWCGLRHQGRQGRCTRRHDAEAPLHVIPGDPAADARRVVDVDQVLVVCRGCHDRRVTSEQDEREPEPGQDQAAQGQTAQGQAGQDRAGQGRNRGRW